MQGRLSLALFLFAFLAFGAMPALAQTTLHVDADNTDSGCSGASSLSGLDGSTWDCAYPALQDAFDEVKQNSGTDYEIWVATGTYYPDNDNVDQVSGDDDGASGTEHVDGSSSESFTLTRDDVEVYGGFQSGDSFGDRDSDANVVTLSGDVDGDGAPSGNSEHVLIFDGGDGIGADVSSNITSATVLNGVTVTEGGNATGSSPFNYGGGLYCDGARSGNECSPQITNVSFVNNRASRGGAIYNDGRDGTSSTQITNVTFANNSASTGGAIYNTDGTSSTQITNVAFASNSANQIGGAIYNDGTGPSNTSSPKLTNVTFAGNSSGSSGGAIYNDGASAGTSSPQITNVTFVGNNADRDGGAILNNGGDGTSEPVIVNTILWGNRADADGDGTGSGDEVHNKFSASPSIDYSIVEGGDAGIANGSSFSNGTGNLDKNPQFAGDNGGAGSDGTFGTSDDDLRLQGPGSGGGASPAIDAGDNTAISQSVDLAGNTRQKDVSGVANTGNAPNGNPPVDMGAYESTGAPLPVELASFDARSTEGAVRLTWNTASETGNAGFAVQRWASGGAWMKVGFVGSKAEGGTTTQPQSYQFTDADLPYEADALTYRLKQVDTDGTAHYSKTVTVERGVTKVQLLGTYPNPARQQATVRYALPEKQAVEVRLYDVLGRQVRTVVSSKQEGRHERAIDVSGLSSGVYFLRLRAGGETRTQKLTVVR